MKKNYKIIYYLKGGNFDCKINMHTNMPNICEQNDQGEFRNMNECAESKKCISKWFLFKTDPKNNPELLRKKNMSDIDNFVKHVKLRGTLTPPVNPMFDFDLIGKDRIRMRYSGFETHKEAIDLYKPKYTKNEFFTISNSNNINRLLKTISDNSENNLFVIPDFHGHQTPESVTMLILDNYPKKIDRIFVEFDYRVQPAVDQYLIDGNLETFYVKIPYLLRSLEDVFKKCQKDKIDMVCVDSYPLDKDRTGDNDLCRRNQFMSESINAVKRNDNSSEIYIVGGRHIEFEFSVIYHLLPKLNKYLVLLTDILK